MLLSRKEPDKRFRKDLLRAATKYNAFHDACEYSKTPELGKLAIVASQGTTTNSNLDPKKQVKVFLDEAEELLSSDLAAQYSSAEVHQVASNIDLSLILQDSDIAGIVLIGHGTIAALRLRNDKYFNWQDVSRASTHLKLGHFVQRMCGFYRVDSSAPLGTFVMADQRKVYAALGEAVEDINPPEESFISVFSEPKNSTEGIIDLRNRFRHLQT